MKSTDDKNKRSDFSKETKEKLAKRVGYRCSCPTCRRFTVGPKSDADGYILNGEACHIYGARKTNGSPRVNYDKSDEELKDIENGIWLCSSCHKKVDSDPTRYNDEVLREWKKNAEELQDKLFNGVSQCFIEGFIFNCFNTNKGIHFENFNEKDWCLLTYMISIYINNDCTCTTRGLEFLREYDEVCFEDGYSSWLNENNIKYETSGFTFTSFNRRRDNDNLNMIVNDLVGLVTKDQYGLGYGTAFEDFVNFLFDFDDDANKKIIKDLSIF